LKPGEMKIINALMRSENGLSFTELKAEVKLSAPVLSEYLKNLVGDGFIDKDVRIRKYKLKRIFFPWKELSSREQAMRFYASSAPILAMSIKRVKDDATRLELITEFMKMFLMDGGSVMVFNIIVHALEEWDSKGRQNLDLLLPILKEQIENWIVPYTQKLALAVALFDIQDLSKTVDVMDEIASHWNEQIKKTIDVLRKHQALLKI